MANTSVKWRSWCYHHPGSVCVVVLTPLLVAAGVAIREWIDRGARSGLLPEGPLWSRLLIYACLALASCLFVAYDYSELGPTIAIWRGVVAAAVAWFFAVPLGTLSDAMIRCMWIAGICSLGVFILYTLRDPEDRRWTFLGVLFLGGSVLLAFNGLVLQFVAHHLGCLVVFLVTYFLVRLLMQERLGSCGPVSLEGVEKIAKSSDEFKEIEREFKEGCGIGAGKYPFGLQIGKVYKVQSSPGSLERTKDEGRRLFHGTVWESAQGILADGFRLPSRAGMFGKGIYFADCPLKSWQYTDGRPWRPGVMLYCWVELGRSKQAKAAIPGLSRPPNRNLWQWISGSRRYDSVTGVDQSEGGSLRLPEYIVYDPSRVEVDYVLEVWSLKGRGAE